MIFCRAPMRISFLGGGSDFSEYYSENQGFVVSAAINKYIYLTVNNSFEDVVKLHYSNNETVESVDLLKHDLARTILNNYKIKRKIEISSISDLPSSGTGMGSSSSYCVGLLAALHRHRNGYDLKSEDLAQLACDVEIRQLEKPIGKQDQYISAYGGLKNFTFLSDGNVKVGTYDLSNEFLVDLESHLLLLYTEITRSADKILKVQAENTKNNKETKKTISEVVKLAKILDENFKKENHSVMGDLLNEAWDLKKNYAPNVSQEIIDDIYEKAKQAGVKGGKLLGAGGGGFFLLYAKPEDHINIISKMHNYRFYDLKFAHHGCEILFDSAKK